MRLNSGEVLAVLALAGLLVTVAAAVAGSWRVSRNQQVLTNYREAAKAWEARSDAQQAEMEELKADNARKASMIAGLEKQITELRGHMNALQEIMVGTSALDTLRQEIALSRDQILAAIGARP